MRSDSIDTVLIDTLDPEQFVETVLRIAAGFGVSQIGSSRSLSEPASL